MYVETSVGSIPKIMFAHGSHVDEKSTKPYKLYLVGGFNPFEKY